MAQTATDLSSEPADLTERTYRTLKELIVTRAIPAGGKVTAEGLSQRFGVSRTTVKGAIDQLASEGLVEVRPQVGTFVRGLSATDVRDAWDVRLMLEVTAVQRGVMEATSEQRRELHELVSVMAPLVNDREYVQETYDRSVEVNRRFHDLLVETAGNSYLASIYRQLGAHFHIANYRSRVGLRRADLGLVEHRAIVEAYDRHDPEAATATLTLHVQRSRDVVLEAVSALGELL